MQDGAYIGGNYEIKSVIPPGVDSIVYEYYFDGIWHLIGNESMKVPFIWNTSAIDYGRVDVRAIAYRDGKVVSTDVNENITIDNIVPDIKIVEPEKGEDVKDFALVRYNTCNNTAFVEIQYSTDNKTWKTAGVDISGRNFIFPVENYTGNIFLKATAFSDSGLNSSYITTFKIMKEKEMTAFGKLTFILNSINVGWNFLKLQSVLGEPGEIPVNFYKSFFNARGTDAHFAFFVFVPFLVLSFFAPITYLKKKRKFGMIDGLMLSYIILHLFIFLNISIHQGGGYDVRWYLPLHLPFLYFSIVATEDLITTRFWDIMKAYFVSLIVLFPVFIWAFWITSLNKVGFLATFLNFVTICRFFGDALIILLPISLVVWILFREKLSTRIGKKYRDISDQILPSLVGVSMFVGTLILIVITILYSRGLYKTCTQSGIDFTMVIPIIKIAQYLLQGILR